MSAPYCAGASLARFRVATPRNDSTAGVPAVLSANRLRVGEQISAPWRYLMDDYDSVHDRAVYSTVIVERTCRGERASDVARRCKPDVAAPAVAGRRRAVPHHAVRQPGERPGDRAT